MTALKSIKTQAYQIIIWQLIIIVGLAIVLFLFRGIQNGYSTLLGGLAYWLPTLLFVWRVFARATVRAARQFVLAFFAGEIMKLFLSAVLFLLIVKYVPVDVLSVLLGFMGAIVAFWVAAVYFMGRHQGATP